MFSRRTAWNRAPNALASKLEALRRSGAPLVDLTESNPTRAGLSLPPEAIVDALRDPSVATYAPDPRGASPAREAIARWLTARTPELPVGASALILSASTSESYAWLFKLLCDPGDSVLVPRPSYPLFDFLTGLESVTTRPYPLRFDGEWHLSIDDVAAAADDRTRAILVVNPGNPTGAFLRRAELVALQQLCAARGWALISDEVFAESAYEAVSRASGPDDRVRRAATAEAPALTFSLSGLSKIAAAPQLKLGWICVGGPEPQKREALERLEVIADTYLSVSAPAQAAVPHLLAQAEVVSRRIRERVTDNRGRLLALRGEDAQWSVLPAEAGWSAIVRIPSRVDEEAICLQLLDDGVGVQPGYFYDFEGGAFLIVSLLPEPGAFAHGAARLAARLDSL